MMVGASSGSEEWSLTHRCKVMENYICMYVCIFMVVPKRSGGRPRWACLASNSAIPFSVLHQNPGLNWNMLASWKHMWWLSRKQPSRGWLIPGHCVIHSGDLVMQYFLNGQMITSLQLNLPTGKFSSSLKENSVFPDLVWFGLFCFSSLSHFPLRLRHSHCHIAMFWIFKSYLISLEALQL